ncbi:hypothetical protein F4677DRAFT_457885 [Hypoxylon crocopeplum]|nr:hypothetical protein F4677DRAFT_457885 [Hypoxylon crocopeplum]
MPYIPSLHSPPRKKTLCIFSHDSNSTLSPPPDLQYDLRCVPSPPELVCEMYTGQSSEVREGLLHESRFCELLEQAKAEIQGAMEAAGEEEEEGKSREAVVRVSCLCGSGHHRSVAFSEQLAQMEWPEDWELELRHHDLILQVKEQKERERQWRQM